MNFKNAFAAAWNAVGNVIYYPSKWNPLVGQPKRLDELNLLEMFFLGIRRQTILKPGFVGAAPAGAVGGNVMSDVHVDEEVHLHSEPPAGVHAFSEPRYDTPFDDQSPLFDGGTGCFIYNHTMDPSKN